MTFCRRGNDYADVAQPFRLTGGSHGGGGDTAAAASRTGDRHAPAPHPHPPLNLRPPWAQRRLFPGGGGADGKGLSLK